MTNVVTPFWSLSERGETNAVTVPVAVGAVCARFGGVKCARNRGFVQLRRGVEKMIGKFL